MSAKLEANVTITGVWDIARPVSATWSYDPDNPIRVVEIIASIEKRVRR